MTSENRLSQECDGRVRAATVGSGPASALRSHSHMPHKQRQGPRKCGGVPQERISANISMLDQRSAGGDIRRFTGPGGFGAPLAILTDTTSFCRVRGALPHMGIRKTAYKRRSGARTHAQRASRFAGQPGTSHRQSDTAVTPNRQRFAGYGRRPTENRLETLGSGALIGRSDVSRTPPHVYQATRRAPAPIATKQGSTQRATNGICTEFSARGPSFADEKPVWVESTPLA